MSARRASPSEKWKRWRKYPPTHLLIAAAHRTTRKLARRLRPPVPPGGTPVLAGATRREMAEELCGRLALPPLTPGEGLPRVPPFPRVAESALIVESARRVLDEGPLYFGRRWEHGAWSVDPVSAYRWPLEVSRSLPMLPGPGTDVKHPWELGRFHYVGPLVNAYLITGEASWIRAALDLVLAFIDENPFGRGVQWISGMEAAIRATNWCYVLAAALSGDDVSDDEARRIARALYEHGWFVRRELSWNPHSRGNHYFSELVGLLHLGLALGPGGEAGGWARFSARRLAREADIQIHPDGGNWEASTNYHRFVAELLGQAVTLLSGTTVPVGIDPAPLRGHLDGMLDVVDAYTRPDGSAPLIGDVDDGRLLALSGTYEAAPDRHAAHLSAYRGPGEDRPQRSRSCPATGWHLLRAPGALVAIRCGPTGLAGRGAHDHADQLSLDATLGGEAVFVDPGTPAYSGAPEIRQEARSTGVHSTIAIDGLDQSTFCRDTLFEVLEAEPGRTVTWEEGREGTTFRGRHDGYRRLADPVTHQRTVHLAADGRSLEIVDELLGPESRHDVSVAFQCSVGVRTSPDRADDAIELVRNGQRFLLTSYLPDGLSLAVESGWTSPGYGVLLEAPRLRFHGTTSIPATARFELKLLNPDTPT